jgi:alpha-D-xyloside xylohydrolase
MALPSGERSIEELFGNPNMQLGGLVAPWPEDHGYQALEAVERVSRAGPRVTVLCRTERGEQTQLLVDVCAPAAFRLQLVGVETEPDRPSEMVVRRDWGFVGFGLEETAEQVRITTDACVLQVTKRPFEWALLDASGRHVVGEHRADTNLRDRPRVPTLGYARDAGGKIYRASDALSLDPDESVYGLGERFIPLNRRGQRIEAWNFNTWGTSTERAYKNVPFFLSTAGYGLFVHSTGRVRFDFGSGERSAISTTFEAEDDRLDVYLFHGPRLGDILDRYTDLTGRAPVPPKWSFGLWMGGMEYVSRLEVEDLASRLRAERIPCDVINLDNQWMRDRRYADLVWNEAAYPDPAGMIAGLKAQGFRVVLWIQPWIPRQSEVFAEAADRGYFARRQDGSIYLYVPTIPAGEPNPSGIVDFTNPEAAAWYGERIGALVRMGVDGFKTDFAEAIPEDGVFHAGPGRRVHNIYSFYYNRTVYEAVQRHHRTGGVVWGRSGWAGSQRFPIAWSGDPLANFRHMACTLWGGLSAGLSGIPFWSHDIGGYHGPPGTELYLRWAAFCLLSSHARAHGDTTREPWAFGQEALATFRGLVRLRYRLLPYIYSCAQEAHLNGWPVLRAMVLEFQDDPLTHRLDLQYMLGPCLLVAPVMAPGGRGAAYLPAGQWRDFWTGQEVIGPLWWHGQVALNRIPLFQREDTIVAFGPDLEGADHTAFDPLTLRVNLHRQAHALVRDVDETLEVTVRRFGDEIAATIGPTGRRLLLELPGVPHPRRVNQNGAELPGRDSLEALGGEDPGWYWRADGGLLVRLAHPAGTTTRIGL